MVKPRFSNFRMITANFSGVRIFRIFLVHFFFVSELFRFLRHFQYQCKRAPEHVLHFKSHGYWFGWTEIANAFQVSILYGLRQANLVLIAYASSEGSGEPAHPRSLARTSVARSYKQ